MVSRRLVSSALTLTLLAAGLPTLARAEAAPEPLRASIDRALSAPVPAGPAAPVRRSQDPGVAMSGGGGGGGGRMILALLGTAVSVGTAYYMIKHMKKSTDPTPTSFR
jgi:hypothetical protein